MKTQPVSIRTSLPSLGNMYTELNQRRAEKNTINKIGMRSSKRGDKLQVSIDNAFYKKIKMYIFGGPEKRDIIFL